MVLIASLNFGNAQVWTNANLEFRVTPRYQDRTIALQDTIFRASLDDVTIETLRFYISKIDFYSKGYKVRQKSYSQHLIDAADTSTYTIKLACPSLINVDEITFLLGIDSLTSTSGAFGGDLDPTNGMYWAWNSGYINFKIEGKSSQCPTRDNGFQFHLGGYAAPYANAQEIRLSIQSIDKLNIAVDLSNFFDQIDLSKEHTIMSPSQKAVSFSELISKSFYIDE